MNKELPEIYLEKHASINIQVMNFDELFGLLNKAKDHSPYEPHKIKFYLILIVTKGTYSHFIDFKTYDMYEGSALFITKNQVHYFNKELQDCKGYGIVFNQSFVDKHYFLNDNFTMNSLFNYHIERPIIHQREMEPDNLVNLSFEIFKEYSFKSDLTKSETLASLLRVLLLKVERAKRMNTAISANNRYQNIFSQFCHLLEEDYVNTRSSRTYANKLFVSYKFLNNIVKELTGTTVKTFIDNFVIVEIKRYLISSSLSVSEISYKTGFEEPANMIKFFKKHTNNTPLKFRKIALP